MNDSMSTKPCELEGVQLAMVYSPPQPFRSLYSSEQALARGTLFEELDKPLSEVER